MTRVGWRRPAFFLVGLLTLGLAGLFGGMVVLMNIRPGFMGMAHFTEPSHRIHDVTFALLNGTAVVGMLAQLRAPLRNIASQLMALIPFAGLLLAVALTNTWVLSPPWLLVGASAVLAAMFHPAGDPLRTFGRSRVNRVMLALVAIAAVPLLAFALTNIGLQRAGPTEHALMGHYGFMAAFSFTVIGAGLLSSARPDGWRLTAWVAGSLPILLGLASVVFSNFDSRLSLDWLLRPSLGASHSSPSLSSFTVADGCGARLLLLATIARGCPRARRCIWCSRRTAPLMRPRGPGPEGLCEMVRARGRDVR